MFHFYLFFLRPFHFTFEHQVMMLLVSDKTVTPQNVKLVFKITSHKNLQLFKANNETTLSHTKLVHHLVKLTLLKPKVRAVHCISAMTWCNLTIHPILLFFYFFIYFFYFSTIFLPFVHIILNFFFTNFLEFYFFFLYS